MAEEFVGVGKGGQFPGRWAGLELHTAGEDRRHRHSDGRLILLCCQLLAPCLSSALGRGRGVTGEAGKGLALLCHQRLGSCPLSAQCRDAGEVGRWVASPLLLVHPL